MFKLFSIIILLLIQSILYVFLRKYVSEQPKFPVWSKTLLTSIFLVFNLPLIVLYFFLWKVTLLPSTTFFLFSPLFIWHAATVYIFAVLICAKTIKLVFKTSYKVAIIHPKIHSKVSLMKSSPSYEQFNASRRSFMQKGFVGLSAYSFIGATAGADTKGDFEIKRKTIVLPNLPPQLKGFTIGMMSDIHSSIFMNKEDMDGYVSAMNKLGTDLIVVTGDFVNSQTEEVYPFAEAFSNLKASFGVYGCLGNHDFFARDVERVAKEVDNCGVKLLRNDAVKIQKDGSFFNLVGVDDIGRNTDPSDYFSRALAFAKNDQPKILLCHKPYYFHHAKDLGIDLTLSGHTHGGQIVFGVIDQTPISLAALSSKYISGLYSLDQSQLYVNDGIGFTGIPVRINCPAELTVITLA